MFSKILVWCVATTNKKKASVIARKFHLPAAGKPRALYSVKRPGEKVIVGIVTKNRDPEYLHSTVHSVAELATRFGHDIEIVVSDGSTKSFAEKNARAMAKVKSLFPSIPIHHYSCIQAKAPISELFRAEPNLPKQAYFELVPPDGRIGANRNALALYSIYHGGKSAAYFLLDDDTPLLDLKTVPGPHGPKYLKVKRHSRDLIGQYLSQYRQAIEKGAPGYTGGLIGVPASVVSSGQIQDTKNSLAQSLRKRITVTTVLQGCPGKMVNFRYMSQPYHPYHFGQVYSHALEKDVIESESMANFGADVSSYFEKHPFVLHIGITGYYNPAGKDKTIRFEEFSRDWKLLSEKMAEFGEKQRRATNSK